MHHPLARKEQIISETVAGEYVLYDGLRKRAHRLNPTLCWIWDRCDGSTGVEDIAAAFEREFAVDNGTNAVLSGLKQLDNYELLQRPLEIPQLGSFQLPELSRRRIIAGGSMLMPVLVSMIAPTPAAAKSGKDHDDKDKDKDQGKHKNK